MESKLWGWYNKFFMTWQYHLIWLKIGNKTFFPINNSNDTKLVNFIIVRWYQNSKHYWSFLFPCGSCCKTNIPVSNDRHCVIRWCRFFKCFFFFIFFETKEIDKMWQISHHEPLFLLTCWPVCPMSYHLHRSRQWGNDRALKVFFCWDFRRIWGNIEFKSARKNSGVNEC